jgi:hypothetical protein
MKINPLLSHRMAVKAQNITLRNLTPIQALIRPTCFNIIIIFLLENNPLKSTGNWKILIQESYLLYLIPKKAIPCSENMSITQNEIIWKVFL